MPQNSRDHNRTRGQMLPVSIGRFQPNLGFIWSKSVSEKRKRRFASLFWKRTSAARSDRLIERAQSDVSPNCRVTCFVELVRLVASPARFPCLRHLAVLRSAMPLLSTGFYVRRLRPRKLQHLRRSCEKSQSPTPRTVPKQRILEGRENNSLRVLRRQVTHTHGPAIVRHEPCCSRFRRWTINALQHGQHATFLDLPQESDSAFRTIATFCYSLERQSDVAKSRVLLEWVVVETCPNLSMT